MPRGIVIQSLAMPFLIDKENPALQAGLFATIGGVRFPQLTLMELLKSGPTGDAVTAFGRAAVCTGALAGTAGCAPAGSGVP